MLITTVEDGLHFLVTNFSSVVSFSTTMNVSIKEKQTQNNHLWLSIKPGQGFKIKTAVFAYVLPKQSSEISTKSWTGVESQ